MPGQPPIPTGHTRAARATRRADASAPDQRQGSGAPAGLLAICGSTLVGASELADRLEPYAGLDMLTIVIALLIATLATLICALAGDSLLEMAERRLGHRPGARRAAMLLALAGAVAVIAIVIGHLRHLPALDGWLGLAGGTLLLAAAAAHHHSQHATLPRVAIAVIPIRAPSPTRARQNSCPRGRSERPHAPWMAAGLTLALLAALLVLAITKLGLVQVTRALAHVNAGWAGLALALMATSFLARAESWFAVLGAALPHKRVGRPAVRRGLLIGMAGSTVAPGRLGEAARAWIIARRLGNPGQHLAIVLGTVVSQTLLNLFALGVLAAVTVTGAASADALLEAIIVALGLPAVILAVALTAPRLLRRSVRSRSRRLRRIAHWLIHQLIGLRKGLTVFRQPRAAMHAGGAQLSAWALQLGAWALQLGACYAVILALGLGHQATLTAAAAVLLAVNLTAVVPLTPSNVGVFQAACIAVLSPFGVAASQGLAYGLILQAVEITSALALGLPALLREGLSPTELSRQASGQATKATNDHA